MSGPVVSIFARWPEPGKAKTRLIPRIGPEDAAATYGKLLEHTIAVARDSGLSFELRVTGAPDRRFRDWFGRDVAVVDQGDGDLTAKLKRASAPGLCIGSDCPGLTPDLLREAARNLDEAEIVLGPASDGGYWLVGFSNPSPWLFEEIAWSTDAVLEQTLAACSARGIEPAMLSMLSDIDEPADLDDWPEFLP